MKKLILFVCLLAGCGRYEPLEDAVRNAVPQEHYGAPRGIWQGENPPNGTVRDCVNISTHRGYWSNRPGAKQLLTGIAFSQFLSPPTAIAEYIPDSRYETSHDYCIIAVQPGTVSPGNYMRIIEDGQTQFLMEPHPEFQYTKRRMDHARVLLKYVKRTLDDGTDVYDYTPAILFTNGLERPFVYSQRTTTSGATQFEMVKSLDGGDSDISYLEDVPKGKYISVFKERIFMANVEGAGNRIYHTGPDDAGVWSCNIWPSEYNFDVGSGSEEITGLKVFRDALVIFKERSTWVLTGDGVNGVWNIQKVDGLNGALEWCVEDVGDALMFVNRSGVYVWNGGLAKRISHPQLEETWQEIRFTGNYQTGFDPMRRLFFFSTGSGIYGEDGHQILVYDLQHQAWTRWGTWRGDDGVPSDLAYVTMFVNLNEFSSEPFLAFAKGNYLCYWDGNFDESPLATPDTMPIHWLVRSQPFADKQWRVSTARRITLDAKKTGEWHVWSLVTVDGEGPVDSMRRRAAGKWNLIMDSANQASHDVNGQSQFMKSSDGPVDVLFFPANYKIGDSLSLADGTDPSQVVFASSFNSTGMPGHLLVVPEDSSGIVQFDMDDGDTMGDPTGDTVYQEPRFVKQSQGCNATGKVFEVWLSNMGDYNVSGAEAALGKYAIEGMPFEARGWGLWLAPSGGVRP
jgi:hypothetical protein